MDPMFVEAYHPETGDHATFSAAAFEAWREQGWELVESETPAPPGDTTRDKKSVKAAAQSAEADGTMPSPGN